MTLTRREAANNIITEGVSAHEPERDGLGGVLMSAVSPESGDDAGTVVFPGWDVSDGAGDETLGGLAGDGEFGASTAGEGAFVGVIAEGDGDCDSTGAGDIFGALAWGDGAREGGFDMGDGETGDTAGTGDDDGETGEVAGGWANGGWDTGAGVLGVGFGLIAKTTMINLCPFSQLALFPLIKKKGPERSNWKTEVADFITLRGSFVLQVL